MIYGTAWKKDKTAQLVGLAIDNGFRAIDTACQPKHYNEKQVGEGISRAIDKSNFDRNDLFLQTKFTPVDGQDPNNIPYNPNDNLEKQICDSLELSLANLQTDYIDSYLLHSPLFPFEKTLKAWRVLESFVEKGYVKQIGISNCYDLQLLVKLYDISSRKPKVLQNRFYEHSDYDKDLRSFCNAHEISYQSFWSLTANPQILGSKEVYTLAKKYNKTTPQIFYRFLTQLNITPLNGTTSTQHMKEDLSIKDFELQTHELVMINNLL